MAGIYIHIPFCRRACHYCNFHFSTSLRLQNDFLTALLKEIGLRRDYAAGEPVDTVYFGGGTPSLLTADHLASIVDAIHQFLGVSPDAEMTLEANPDDIDAIRVTEWRRLGVNRLSIGVQSFFDEDLVWMNRAHNAAQADAAVRRAQDGGIDNLSIDLIYGTPGLSDERWLQNMQRAVELGVPHLSCYALTVEPGTALHSMTVKRQSPAVDQERQAGQFLMMTDFFKEKGYEHYEISNLAVPGKRSRHNSSYWSGEKYIGVGPSAHSFDGISRQWNVANNALYIQAILRGEVPFEMETLSEVQRFNEYVMTSLRKSEGVDRGYVQNVFGGSYADALVRSSRKFVEKSWVEDLPQRLVLTREGKLFADLIASELFAG